MPRPMTFGECVRAERTRARMTYRAMAEATALSIAYLHDIEHGRRPAPSRRVVDLIVDALADWSKSEGNDRGLLRHGMRELARLEVMQRAAARWERGDDA